MFIEFRFPILFLLLGITLDTLVYSFGVDIPDYIKIDVDGNELLILQGAKRLLNEFNI